MYLKQTMFALITGNIDTYVENLKKHHIEFLYEPSVISLSSSVSGCSADKLAGN